MTPFNEMLLAEAKKHLFARIEAAICSALPPRCRNWDGWPGVRSITASVMDELEKAFSESKP